MFCNWPYQTSLVALLPTGDAHLPWWLTAPPIQFRSCSLFDLSGCGKRTRMDPAVHCPCVTGVQRRHQRVRRGRDLARTASGHHASAISSAGHGRGAASSSQTYLCCYFPKPTFISVSFHILVLKACLGFLGRCLLRGGQMKSESHRLKEQEPVSAGWLTGSPMTGLWETHQPVSTPACQRRWNQIHIQHLSISVMWKSIFEFSQLTGNVLASYEQTFFQ